MGYQYRKRRWIRHRKGLGTWHDAKHCSRCGTYHGSPDGCPADRYLDRQYLVEVYIPEGYPLLTGPNEEAGWYALRGYGREDDARMRAREAAKYKWPEARVVDQWEDVDPFEELHRPR